MINPKTHKKGSPEWVLAKFFEAWKRRTWKQMVDYIQSSWLRIYTEPDKWLKLTFSPELIDARLIQASGRTPAVTEYLVEIEYMALRTIPKKVVSKIRLYSEMTSFRETVWGVDPTTIALKFELIRKPVADEEAEKKDEPEEKKAVTKSGKTPRKSRSKT